jgi:hypothetical protein
MFDCQQLIGLPVSAVNGLVGRLTDLCFDDERWVVRYLVVATAFTDQATMVALGTDDLADDQTKRTAGRLTSSVHAAGLSLPSSPLVSGLERAVFGLRGHHQDEPQETSHLQRCEEVRGYEVFAEDGYVGTVEGFLISDTSWTIEYVVVQASQRLVSHRIVVPTSWIKNVVREESRLSLGMSCGTVLSGPEFTDDITQAYETWLLAHLGRAAVSHAH